MISDEIVIKELLKFKKPVIDGLMAQIKSKVSKLPSDSQLQKFKSIVLNRTVDNISDYLEKREEVSGSESWVEKSFSGNKKSFKDLILEVIIMPVKEKDTLDPDSTLWEIDLTEFIIRTGLAWLDINITNYREIIIRKIITKMIDEIKIKRSLDLECIGVKI